MPITLLSLLSPIVQFQLLHSKYHLCSVQTRALLLSTYVKFINLFPEIKSHIQIVSYHLPSLHPTLISQYIQKLLNMKTCYFVADEDV